MSEEKGAGVPSYTNDSFQRDRELIRKQARDIDRLTAELKELRVHNSDLCCSLTTVETELEEVRGNLEIVTADRDIWKAKAQELVTSKAIDDCNKSFQWRTTALQLGRDRYAYLDATRALVQVVNSLMKVGCSDIHHDDQYDLEEEE